MWPAAPRHPRRRRRHHAAQPCAAGDCRAVRHPGLPLSGTDRPGPRRAPGTDQVTAHALRRTLAGDVDAFPQDVMELMSYFQPVQPGQAVRAIPGAGVDVPIWILDRACSGRNWPRRWPALCLRLPLRAGRHGAGDRRLSRAVSPIGPARQTLCDAGSERDRRRDDEAAKFLFSSLQQAFINLRTGRPGPCRRRSRA